MHLPHILVVAFTVLFTYSSQVSLRAEVFSTAMHGLPLIASSALTNGKSQPFIEHIGAPGDRYGTTLAMNTPNAPIASLRRQISEQLGLSSPLKFFTGFAKEGEAHVTTVTPVEYHDKLRGFVRPETMTQIALQYNIQASDLQILGIGKGSTVRGGNNQDTYFVIVHSENLLRIRRAIYEEYLRNKGPAENWDPEHFYPHITIGFTDRDLHEVDGVIKDLQHSLDPRFSLFIQD